MKTPHDFIKEAGDIINQRGTDNGYDKGQERSAAQIAAVFNALTGRDLTEQDVWTLLLCLKLVRNQRKYKHDNILDMLGYVALLGESLDAGLAQQVADQFDATPQQVEALARTPSQAKPATTPEAGVARRAISAREAEEKAAAGAIAQVVDSLLTGVSLEVASGHHLDAWAKLLHTERLTFGVVGSDMRTEEDQSMRARLIEIRKMQARSKPRTPGRFA